MQISSRTKLISFTEDIQPHLVPISFPSPYEDIPHELSIVAAQQLLNFIVNSSYWKDIPLYEDLKAHARIGKMFGVLVVRDPKCNTIGFLAGFSGKLLGRNEYKFFVPPVFDMLDESNHYVKEEQELLKLSELIHALETNSDYLDRIAVNKEKEKAIEDKLKALKISYLEQKKNHMVSLQKMKLYSEVNTAKIKALEYDIIGLKQVYKADKKSLSNSGLKEKQALEVFKKQILDLKTLRKSKSKNLQQWLYKQYKFLNTNKDVKDLQAIFKKPIVPPSGAGECAAPKLLHHAFKHNLEPLCMAEFWWGRSPSSNHKTEGEYYPPCEEKCRPILKHMLKGIL